MIIKEFTQIGKRQNNEDSYGYNNNLATVCDGMGGHVCGEMASGFIVKELLKYFDNPVEDLNKERIQNELDKAQQGLNKILDEKPELEKMGTTFTGLFFSKDFWYAAHIGDSRIYLFRPSEHKLWHTWDQSLVGELMRHHEITREAGRHHPMSNRISNAIMANAKGKVATASIVKINQLQEGDIFLLCSDGVVEAWGDHELVPMMLDASIPFEEKCQRLAKQCNKLSKDNNTALVIQVEAKDAFNNGDDGELTWITESEIMDDYQEYLKTLSIDEIDDAPASETESVPAAVVKGDVKAESGRNLVQSSSTAPLHFGHSDQGDKPKRKKLTRKDMLIILFALIILALCLLFVIENKSHDENAGKTEEKTEVPVTGTDDGKTNRADMKKAEREARRAEREEDKKAREKAEADAKAAEAKSEAACMAAEEAERRTQEAEAEVERISSEAEAINTVNNDKKKEGKLNNISEMLNGTVNEPVQQPETTSQQATTPDEQPAGNSQTNQTTVNEPVQQPETTSQQQQPETPK